MIEGENIAMIGAYPPIHSGGVATHIHEISKELSKHNTITVITTGTKKGYWDDYVVKVYQEKLWYPQRYTTFQSMVQTTKRALSLRKKVDLYHAHGDFFSGIGFLDKQKPLVLTVHGYSSLETVLIGRIKLNSFQFKFRRWIEKKAVERADGIIAVGSKLKEWIINELYADAEKVFLIPNGIDIKLFKFATNGRKEVLRRHSISNSPVILFTKHFSPRYGAQYLIPAMREIIKDYPSARLIMTNDDPWKEKIIKLAKKYGVIDNIILPGCLPYEDLPKYYSACDVFVHPSINDQETFGISLIEAMACSKPVVATAVGGPKEIIEGGENVGMLIPPKNSEAIANAIIELLNNPLKSNQMGQNARKYVESKFTWEKVVEEISKVYQYALEAHSKK
jgi:glycosyltransferase involved in cell wall biosynthesis